MQNCCQEKRLELNQYDFINELVNKLCSTYQDEKGINHIEGFNLPQEKEVLSIVKDLMELIFPGFSGEKSYSLSTIRYNAGDVLSKVYTELLDQIFRSFRYDCTMNGCEGCDLAERSANTTRKLLESLPELRNIMKLDVAAAYEGDPAAKSLDEIVMSYPGVKAITIQRLAHILYHEKVPLMPRMMTEYAHQITGIDIHPGAHLEEGVFIDHATGVVIGETAVIGKNVKIYQGVTLGALSFPKDACGKIIKGAKRHPTIEDNVTIYSGATILGNIVIGEGSTVGGNVWLTESVEPGTLVLSAHPDLQLKNRKKKQENISISATLKLSAEKAFKDYLKIQKDEKVLLIYDETTLEIAKTFEEISDELKIPLTMRKIELTGGNGKNPDPETCAMMKEFSAVIAPTKYSLTHCSAVTEARKHKVRVATLPGITNGIFERGMKTNPLELKSTGDKFLKKLEGKHTVKVQSPGGTDIEFNVGKYKIVNDDGCIWENGMCGNLPAGEIFIAPDPKTANGTLVFDGSIGSFDWNPDDKPAIIKLENGSAVSFEGERGKKLEKTLEKHGEKGFVLAEFGIGSNPYVKMGGNLLEDEKIKGTVHFAFGDNCGFGGSNSVPVHIDGLILSPTITIDGNTELMKNGKWLV